MPIVKYICEIHLFFISFVSFFISWEYKRVFFTEDVEEARRACIRVNNPPGGRSAGGFW